MRRLFVPFLLLFFSLPLFAVVRVQVVDPTGASVAGARVVLRRDKKVVAVRIT